MINQEFEKRCMAFMKELKKKPFYSQFEKLGPDLVNSPEYKQLCPHPMDYATVIMNLSSHNYHNYRDWVKDMYLIYDNAIKFNEGKIIYMCKISALFRKKVEKFAKLLDNMNQRNFEQNLFNAYRELKNLLQNYPSDYFPKFDPTPQTEPFDKKRISALTHSLNSVAKTKKNELLSILNDHQFTAIKEDGTIDLSLAGRDLLLELEKFVKK